jgi:hypothetical protein
VKSSFVLHEVKGNDYEEVARKMAAIDAVLLGDAPQPAPQAPQPTDPAPAPAPDPAPRGLIDVGVASGKRGDTVTVEVRGHAEVPVMGFAAAIGYESRDLGFVGAEFGPVWGGPDEHTVIADWARDSDHPMAGNAGAHVALNLARFVITSEDPEAVGEEAGKTFIPVFLNQGALLATLTFKITDKAKVGRALPLLNQSGLFGKPKITAIYTTLTRPAVVTDLDDGSIVVTG